MTSPYLDFQNRVFRAKRRKAYFAAETKRERLKKAKMKECPLCSNDGARAWFGLIRFCPHCHKEIAKDKRYPTLRWTDAHHRRQFAGESLENQK